MSGTVNKLRFMQKARDSETSLGGVHATTESTEQWALTQVDSSLLFKPSEADRKLTTISVMARRSYGGANPYIEQQMELLDKSKKRRKN